MIQNPCDGTLVSLGESGNSSRDYICVFSDETNNNWKKSRYHQNLSGLTTIKELYQLVSTKSNYKYGTFLLAYTTDNEYSIVDFGSEGSIEELLRGSKQKRNNFVIKQRDGKDPVTVIVDDIRHIEQDSNRSPDVESYAGAFFKCTTENEMSKDYALPSTSSYTSFPSYANSPTSTKSNTGFVGLVNQAMTCYLNSLLQTLFMTPEFRNALYRWRYSGSEADSATSIPYQLQKLFLKLEMSKKKAVETCDLTKSFGWDSSEAWQQHDVQELCRVMFDALEGALRNTEQANLINQLYLGTMNDYVKCLKCGHENRRLDNYLDISLDIRPFGSNESHETLEEALQAFITPETLDGINQYFCSKCNSKQDAHKGLKFVSFPYLLTIQLKRFTFDFNTLQRIKLHDRLSFPFSIDLDGFIEDGEKTINGEEIGACSCPPEEKAGDIFHADVKNTDGEINGDTHDIRKGRHIYNLYSVLIHSGSALGGHYYAYIKSFDDDKWYCFNDQYVSEVSLEDIEKSYGGIDKNRGGYYTSNYSSSANAYMLMYRRVDNTQNTEFIKKCDWSQSLLDLCSSILKEEVDVKSKMDTQKDICNIRVYCIHPKSHVKIDCKVAIHKDKTLTEATEIVWKMLKLKNSIPVDQCRLLKYDDYNESYDKSYDGEEDTPISSVLGGARLSYGYDLLLECRQKNEQFKVYSPGGTTLKVYVIDLEESGFGDPRIIHVPLTYTLQELKERLECDTGLPAKIMRIATYKEYHGFYLLTNPKRTLKLEGFYKSKKIFIEGLSEEDSEKDFKESKFYERLEEFINRINIKVTLPFEDEITHEKKEVMLNIDKRITLNELKEKIVAATELKPDSFRVCRLYPNNQEFECTRPDEQLTSYLDDTKLVVKMGRTLKHDEWRIKVFSLDIKVKEYSHFMMEAIIGCNLSVKDLKVHQILPELTRLGKDVSLERLRIRKKSYRSPCRIYPDNWLFGIDITVGYTTELYAEVLEGPETVLGDDDLSVYVRKWNPSTYTIGPLEEVVLHKDTTVLNLKKKLEGKCGIPADQIHIGKGRGVFPSVISVLDIQHEISWNPNATKLRDSPISISDDGAIIYYKDSTVSCGTLTEKERAELRTKEREETQTSSSVRTNNHKEKALKIYSNGLRR